MEERETSERKTEGFQKKLQELFASLNVTLGGDFGQPTAVSFDKLIARVSEQMKIEDCYLSKSDSHKIILFRYLISMVKIRH